MCGAACTVMEAHKPAVNLQAYTAVKQLWNRTNQPYELAGNHERGIFKKHNFSLQKVTSKHYRRKNK